LLAYPGIVYGSGVVHAVYMGSNHGQGRGILLRSWQQPLHSSCFCMFLLNARVGEKIEAQGCPAWDVLLVLRSAGPSMYLWPNTTGFIVGYVPEPIGTSLFLFKPL